jgi:hypothetical protein
MPYAQLPIYNQRKESLYDPHTTLLVESMVDSYCLVYSHWCRIMPAREAATPGKRYPKTSTISGNKYQTSTHYKGEFNHDFLFDTVQLYAGNMGSIDEEP